MAMFTATPTYSAMTPRKNRMTPVHSSSATITEVQPCSTHRRQPADHQPHRQRDPDGAKAAPSTLTRRRPRVPLVTTIRQKWESRVRSE